VKQRFERGRSRDHPGTIGDSSWGRGGCWRAQATRIPFGLCPGTRQVLYASKVALGPGWRPDDRAVDSLSADDGDGARLGRRHQGQEIGNQWPKVSQSIRAGAKDEDRDVERGEVLLE
jgi:hypothetical protein